MCREKLRTFFDRHFHDIADRFFVIENLERLGIVAPAAAVFAGHVTARQKIHLELDYALPLARLATATFGIERESARRIAAHARDWQLRIEIPNLIEHFHIGAWRRARRFTDRRLIDFVNGGDLGRARLWRAGC